MTYTTPSVVEQTAAAHVYRDLTIEKVRAEMQANRDRAIAMEKLAAAKAKAWWERDAGEIIIVAMDNEARRVRQEG